ncbi:phage recombination protein Bet [Deferribacter autotrophicus]|uniref:Phage recombination protein Bet n=1 Tax=Deferribacter autotrophicus TaxID=500465 RepID=A0A5A8F266_9BACT|nr:phage recombination protein Bet [Deferribacter autotrophicus]KAA0257540.1 phage recombination protein Bet [Deferribacter autotrophicus]
MSNVVKLEKSFNEKELEVIKKQFFPSNTSKEEMEYCLAVAKTFGLNPITKEIHFVPRKQQVNGKWIEKVEPLVGRDGFLSIAHKSGQLAGMKTESYIKEVPTLENSKWVIKPDLVARCEVYRKDSDKPFVVEVRYSEYVQYTKDGKPTRFWQKMPDTMLKKVAESQALRKAFNISGIYAAEEVGIGTYSENGDLIIDTEVEITQEDKPTELSKGYIDPDEIIEAFKALGFDAAFGKNRDRIYVRGNFYNKPAAKKLLEMYNFTKTKEKNVYCLRIA